MNLTWNIVRKDFLRHRVAYPLWIALLLIKLAAHWYSFSDHSADIEWFERLEMAQVVLLVVESVVAFLLVGSVVLEDPVIGSSQFWLTRPISGQRLLAAKIATVTLFFVVVPLSIEAVGWWLGGLSGGMLLKQVGAFSLVQTLLVVAAIVFGTFSGRSPRFLLIVLCAFLAIVVLGPVMQKVFPVYPETRALAATRASIGAILLGIAVIGGIWYQFTRRRLWQSSAWLLGGIGLAITAWNIFPWELSRGWNSMPSPLAEAEKVEIAAIVARSAKLTGRKTPLGKQWVELACAVNQLPEGMQLGGGYGRFTFVARDGRRLEAERVLMAAPGSRPEAARAALGLKRLVIDDPETTAAIAKLKSGREERLLAQTRQAQAGAESGRLNTAHRLGDGDGAAGPLDRRLIATILVPDWVAEGLSRGEVAAEVLADISFQRVIFRGDVPVDRDSSLRGDGFRIRIVDRQEKANGASLTIVASRPFFAPRREFAVFHRESGYVGFPQVERQRIDLPRFATTHTVITYHLPKWSRDGNWVNMPGIEQGLRLAVFASEKAGEIRRAAKADVVPWQTR